MKARQKYFLKISLSVLVSIFSMQFIEANPAITVSSTTVSCNGLSDAAVTANILSGSPNYTYILYSGAFPGPFVELERISNTASISLTFTTLLAAGSYYVTVDDQVGQSGSSVTITQPAALSGGTIAGGSPTICNGGDPAAFTSAPDPSGGSGAWSYNWEYQDNCSGGWASIGWNFTTYDPPAGLVNTRCYRRVATRGTCGTVYSNTYTVTVNNLVTTGGTIGSDQTICNNTAPAAFTSAGGGTGGTAPSYVWQYSTTSAIAGVGVWADEPSSNWPIFTHSGNLTQTTYFVRKYFNTCNAVYSNVVTVNVYADLTANVNSTNVTCNGLNNGTITISNPLGGSGTYQYTINGGTAWGASLSYNSLTPSTYNVQMRNSAMPTCTKILNAALVISQPASLSGGAISILHGPTCNNSADGQLQANPIGGTAPYTYQWQIRVGAFFNDIPGETSQVYSLALVGNVYRCVINDVNLCGPVNASLTFIKAALPVGVRDSIPDLIVFGASTVQNACFGQNNGSITVNVTSGGIVPYNYSTTTGGAAGYQASNLFSGLSGATYQQWVQDRRNCRKQGSDATVGEDPLLLVSVSIAQNPNGPFCSGTSITYTATPTNGGAAPSYQWQVNGGNVGANQSTYTTSTLANNDQVSCILTSNVRCKSGDPATSNIITVTVNAAPNITGQPTSPAAICAGAGVATFTVTATGAGLTYQWQEYNGSIWSNLSNGGVYSNVTTATLSVTNPAVGITGYKYRAQVSGTCAPAATSDGNATLTVNAAPSITSQPIDASICEGDNTTFGISATGFGRSYQWEENSGSGWLPISDGGLYSGAQSPDLTITGVLKGMDNYQYRCVVSGTCSPNATSNAVLLTVSPSTAILSQPQNAINCSGNTIKFGVVAIGTGIISYQWQSNITGVWAALSNDVQISGVTTDTLVISDISIDNEGLYRCIVSSSCGAPVTSTDAQLDVNIITATIGKPAPFFISNSTVIEVDIAIKNHSHLDDLSYYLVAPNGTKVSLKHSNYADAGFCNFNNNLDIKFTTKKPITDTISSTCILNATPATYAATGDWNLLNTMDPANGAWRIEVEDIYSDGSNSGEIVSSNLTFTDLNFSGKMESVNYISGAISIPIEDPVNDNIKTAKTQFIVPLGLSVKCFGVCDAKAIVTVAGGIAPFIYSWSDPTLGNNSNVSLCGDSTYTVTVTDALGCSTTATVDVTSPDPIILNSVTYNDSLACFGDKTNVTINATGGTGTLTYTYDGAPAHNDTIAINNPFSLGAGTYNFHVLDLNECTKDTTITIVQPSKILLTDTVKKDITCHGDNNGEIRVRATGGKLLKYQLIDASTLAVLKENAKDSVFLGLAPGNYRVVVTDSINAGCTGDSTKLITVIEPDTLTIDLMDKTDITCHNADNGTITFTTVNGGILPYEYSIDNGANWFSSNTFSNLTAGIYHIKTRDANLCEAVSPDITIVNPDTMIVSKLIFSKNDTLNCFGDTTSILIEITGGTGIKQYTFNGIIKNSGEAITNITGGDYTLHMVDANLCSRDTVIHIQQPGKITITDSVVTNVSCFGSGDASIEVSATGGNILKYQLLDASNIVITDNSINPKFVGLTPGSYRIAVIDSLFGCDGDTTTSITITEPALLVLSSIDSTNVTCYNAKNGTISFSTVTGGTKPYQYSVDNGINWTNNADITGLDATSYKLKVKEANGCQDSLNRTVVLTEPEQVIINSIKTYDATGCKPGQLGAIKIDAQTASGAKSSLKYSTDGVKWIINDSIDLAGGNYTVFVRDTLNPDINCFVSQNVTLTGPTITIDNLLINPPSCYDGNQGSVILVIATGEGTLEYSLNAGIPQEGNDFNDIFPGNYSIHIADQSNGCTKDIVAIVPFGRKIQVKFDTVGIYGLNKGSLTIYLDSTKGGIKPYIYTINKPSIWKDSTFTNLIGGWDTLHVVDKLGCSLDTAFYITPGKILLVDTLKSDVLCYGGSNGNIGLRVDNTNFVPPIFYQIDGPSFDTITSINQEHLFTNLIIGKYSVIAINASGAVYQDSIRIGQPEKMDISISVKDAPCNRFPADSTMGSIDLAVTKGTSPYTYIVSGDTTGSAVSNLVVGNHSIRITDDKQCSVDTSARIDSITNVIVITRADTTVCAGTQLILNAVKSKAGDIYTWSPDTSLSSTLILEPVVTPTKNRTYTLKVLDSSTGCYNTDSTTIGVHPVYGLKISPDSVKIGVNLFATIIASPDTFLTYGWSPVENIVNVNPWTIEFISEKTMAKTPYIVTAITREGCTERDTVYIEVGMLQIPTGFSPNGDGVYDKWVIKSADFFPDIEVSVFNRWGSRVFVSKGYDNVTKVFDGTRNGRDLPVGTYYFIVDPKDGTGPKSGTLTIMR